MGLGKAGPPSPGAIWPGGSGSVEPSGRAGHQWVGPVLGAGVLVLGVGVLVGPGVGVPVAPGVGVGAVVMTGVGVIVTRGAGVTFTPATWPAGGIWICTGWLIETMTRTISIRVFLPNSTRVILRTWCRASTQTVNAVEVMPLDIMSDRTPARRPGASWLRPAAAL